ncbi:isoaspartyl peptidase/L-asparaginase, partial [Pusillimonas noertemannii]|uniref:isoaspartyl peptidase/L-asparaginase family protein n=1 Tax=Pusillimonas noertemannii TaxID=305977 RepID=UPI0015D17357
DAFAREQGLEIVDSSFFSTPDRHAQLIKAQETGVDSIVLDHDGVVDQPPLDESKKMGTVGAVALDAHGNLAAATSTGGMTNKWPGRVGDSPIIGAGCYANNASCAVSTTGKGEAFIRAVAAYDVAAMMEYTGVSLEHAAHKVVYEKLPPLDGAGGLIAVDKHGNITMPFNTEGMYRGSVVVGQAALVAIYRE